MKISIINNHQCLISKVSSSFNLEIFYFILSRLLMFQLNFFLSFVDQVTYLLQSIPTVFCFFSFLDLNILFSIVSEVISSPFPQLGLFSMYFSEDCLCSSIFYLFSIFSFNLRLSSNNFIYFYLNFAKSFFNFQFSNSNYSYFSCKASSFSHFFNRQVRRKIVLSFYENIFDTFQFISRHKFSESKSIIQLKFANVDSNSSIMFFFYSQSYFTFNIRLTKTLFFPSRYFI